jgi:hypothetical protein
MSEASCLSLPSNAVLYYDTVKMTEIIVQIRKWLSFSSETAVTYIAIDAQEPDYNGNVLSLTMLLGSFVEYRANITVSPASKNRAGHFHGTRLKPS